MGINTETNIEKIYSLLKTKGIDKKFIREVLLPHWWDEKILSSKAGFLQTVSLIAKNLGVELSDLISTKGELCLSNQYNIKFKKNTNYYLHPTELFPQSVAARLYNIVFKSFDKEYTLNTNSYITLRNEFLSKYSIFDLKNLLDFLWQKGIPVIFVSEYPRDTTRFDGMAFKFNERPVIVISNKHKHEAWLTFIIAHEFGHIALGHLNKNENLIFDSNISVLKNNEELRSNDFAVNFLVENKNNIPNFSAIKSSFKLANQLRAAARKLKIEPGILALMFAFRYKAFPLASLAINVLYPEANASSTVLEQMMKNLSLELLSEEDLEYFENLTGLSGV